MKGPEPTHRWGGAAEASARPAPRSGSAPAAAAPRNRFRLLIGNMGLSHAGHAAGRAVRAGRVAMTGQSSAGPEVVLTQAQSDQVVKPVCHLW
ncbi:hypothetical protein GCM10009550_18030 [Actinocorallia libanotica]|uniref:Uncharacterized protein n=1 Tax=Actinocorallia libanotica TaxID=46162 RepID=A0ABP4B675_9ACTN